MDAVLAALIDNPAFRSLMDHLPCVVYIARPGWPPAIEYISGNVERLVGCPAEEFYANPSVLFELIHPDDRKRFTQRVRAAMDRGEPYHVEYRVVRRGGGVLHAASLSVPVTDSEGRVVRRHGAILDVTEQKRLEEELLASQRLAAIGEMAGMMAHEIRNPLAGMSLALQALRGLAPPTPEVVECLDDLDGCVVRISDTVTQALDFARVRPPAVRACRLGEIVAGAVRLTAPYARRRGVRVEAQVPPELPPLRGDPSQLEQVFVSLVLYAGKAMPDGGRLAVRAWADGGRALAEVSCSGVGLRTDGLERVLQSPCAGLGDGSGLALSLCQRILAAHGGAFQVRAAPGEGAIFRIELPLEPPDAARPAD